MVVTQNRIIVVPFLAMVFAGPLAAQSATPRSQLTFEGSPTWAGAVTYARRMQDSHFLWGVGTGFAWELNNHSFEGQVWNVIHVEGFARYQPVRWFHGEMGLSVAATSPADDTSERRNFVGLYAAAMIGYGGVLFVGPQARLGFLASDFGHITNLAVRVVIPIGQ